MAPGEVANSNYYAQFDVFEFQFVTSTDGLEITAWGKSAAGDMTVAHNILPAEFFPVNMNRIEGSQGMAIPSVLNRIYVPNSNGCISVFDRNTNTFIGNVIVGSGPFGVGVNSITNRIYVANFGSNNDSVIDGNSNKVIAAV